RRLGAAEARSGPTINAQLFYRRACCRLLGQRASDLGQLVLGPAHLRKARRDWSARFSMSMFDSTRPFSFCFAQSIHWIASMRIARNFTPRTVVYLILPPVVSVLVAGRLMRIARAYLQSLVL